MFALILLVLNDHLFKHMPSLRGVLTGKLSDFAGLVVAPPLLALLFRAQSRAARLACVALVGALFVAIKVSAPCAHGVESVFVAIGVPSRIVVDPTDLLALPSLWLAWRVLHRAEPVAAWAVRGLSLAGLLACLGTTYNDNFPGGSAVLLNHRNAPLSAWARSAPINCEAFSWEQVRALTRADFESPSALTLQAESWTQLSSGQRCGAVWLNIGGKFDHLVAWERLALHHHEYDPVDARLMRDAITVEGTRDVLVVTVGKHLTSLPAPLDGPRTLPGPDAGVDGGASDAGGASDGGARDASADASATVDGGIRDAGP
jgi:hypothetical protein